MNQSIVRLVPRDGYDAAVESDLPLAPSEHRLAAHVRRALVGARGWLECEQRADGAWAGRTEGGSMLQSQYILLLAFLGESDSPRAMAAARWLLQQQLPTGGWSRYPGGPLEISTSVQVYFALKLTCHEPYTEPMQRAREAILAAGGADRADAATRYYLALLGQISYEHCAAMPAEMLWLADRAGPPVTTASLAVIWAQRPVTQIDPRRSIRELFLQRLERWPEVSLSQCQNPTVFRIVKFLERCGLTPLRKHALARAERAILDRLAGNGGQEGFPSLLWHLIALKCLGYASESPAIRSCREQIEGLVIEEDDMVWLQPCQSPIRDTAISIRALLEAGIHPDDESVSAAALWLHEHVSQRQLSRVDESALVTLALWRLSDENAGDYCPAGLQLLAESVDISCESHPDGTRTEQASAIVARIERWMFAMQNRDGGWTLSAMTHGGQASSFADVTGQVLEALGALGRRAGDPAVDRAISCLRRTQEPDGSWRGDAGVNHIHGTWQVLTGLRAVGLSSDDPLIVGGANWLLTWQQACGGWGETPASHDDPRLRGQGPVTGSQTSWALLGLMAAGLADHPAVTRGMRFLVSEQSEDGTWPEPEFTGAGLSGAFRAELYRSYFPLLALSRWLQAVIRG